METSINDEMDEVETLDETEVVDESGVTNESDETHLSKPVLHSSTVFLQYRFRQ